MGFYNWGLRKSDLDITINKVLSRFRDTNDTRSNNAQFNKMLRDVSLRPDYNEYNRVEKTLIRGDPIRFIFFVVAIDNRETLRRVYKSHKSIAKYVAKKVEEYNPDLATYIPDVSSYGFQLIRRPLTLPETFDMIIMDILLA